VNEAPTDSSARILQAKNCYVCGYDNPRGLNIPLYYHDDTVTAKFTPDEAYCGFDGIVHGGILFALCDEAMMHLIWASDLRAITAEVRMRFHRYATVGEEIEVSASFISKSPRLIKAVSHLRHKGGDKIATAQGKFLPLSDQDRRVFKKQF
jgi:acyl-coenzyme A thioesterase PaaI-like protein